jgi:hypothetical protein
MSVNGYGDGLRGVVAFTAEEDQAVAYWRNIYKSQDKARDANRQDKLRSGGDESVFRKIRVLSEDIAEAEPARFSESGLLLDAGIHRIAGPPGAGKTRLAYWEVLQRTGAGQKWAILDAEMGQIRYKQTMKQLGATNSVLKDIYYMDALDGGVPDIMEHGRALSRMLRRSGYHGVLYDSQITFLGASGVSENDAHEVRNWTVATSGMPCVIILDHTGHSNDERSRGTSDKAAGCDVDLVLKTGRPFAVNMPGSISITVNKDRSGTMVVGSSTDIEIECLESGEMGFNPGEWSSDRVGFETTISDLVNLITIGNGRDYATASELQVKLKGRKQNKLDRIRNAVENGEIIEFKDGRMICYSAA